MTIILENLNLITLLSSCMCLIVIGLCLITSIQIMRRYRQKAIFITLIGGLTLAMIPQLLSILTISSSQSAPMSFYITSTLNTIISFILINFVFMKMYAGGVTIRLTPILLLTVGAAAAVASSFFINPYEIEGSGTIALPVLDCYMFILLCTILIVTRQLLLPSAYYISLSVMFLYQITNMLHQYVFKHSELWLSITVQLLPLLYYVLIFYMLLEWIMERLLTTYQTAIADELTGLYMRKHFNKKLMSMLQRKAVAVIFCDIDNFKRLNDTKGHQFADSVLSLVARIIKEEASPYGIAGRYGGEELLAAIDITSVKAQSVAEKIRSRVETETLVTISVGFATTKESEDPSTLVKYADEAMYYAKSTGKNKVVSYKALPAAYKK